VELRYVFLRETVASCLSLNQIVNDEFLRHVRNKRCEYVRGDTQRLTHDGVLVNVRPRGSKPGDEGKAQLFLPNSPVSDKYLQGERREFKGDIVVMATGFERPDLKFIENAELFPEGYEVFPSRLLSSVRR
jgi:hypothetical protein